MAADAHQRECGRSRSAADHGGGWNRLNRVFDDRLDDVLQQFQREVWAA